MSDKIRKYVLPNLPYLFVFWFFSKIGTAYRIAPGTDFGTKLMGMLDTFPKAFETYWPGLGGRPSRFWRRTRTQRGTAGLGAHIF